MFTLLLSGERSFAPNLDPELRIYLWQKIVPVPG